MNKEESASAFAGLLEIMDRLRTGCPWDMEQTNETLRKLTIEETYELADAIIENDDTEICKELGDLMLHIVFYARIGSEKGAFDITDVINGLTKKLIYRHPHIFGETSVSDSSEVIENWEHLKLNENKSYKPVLSGVPMSLPALIKANRIQEKVQGVGFDWEEKNQVWDKVNEELVELKEEIKKGKNGDIESEFGDLLFSVINAARLYNIDPEMALERTNRKFIKRFNYLEEKTIKQGHDLRNLSLDQMNVIWEEAKGMDLPMAKNKGEEMV